MDPDPDSGGPKTCGSGSGSPTMIIYQAYKNIRAIKNYKI
jgi:hypothetical protein